MFRNTPTIKKIIGFSLVGGAFAFALTTVFAAFGSYRLAIDGSSLKKNPAEKPSAPLFAESLPPSEVGGSLAARENEGASYNMTASVAESIAAELLEKNPNGPSLFDGKSGVVAGDPETLIDAALLTALESFDYQTFKPTVALSEITIQENPTPALYERYLRDSQSIIRGTYGGLSFDARNATPETLRRFESAALASVAKLKSLPVPAPLAPFHREEIILLSAEAKVFRALGASAEDPVAAVVALQALASIDEDFKTLTENFNRFLVEKKIIL